MTLLRAALGKMAVPIAAFIVTTTIAVGQPTLGSTSSEQGPQGWGPGVMMGPGMMHGQGFGFMCNPRAAGFAEWRLARIEAAIKPTEAQRAALNDLRTASTKAAEVISAACKAPMPDKSTERLGSMEARLETMLQAVKIVRPAFDKLYAALDDQQKARLDATGPRRWGWGRWHWPWAQ